jgi:hypothetical protein
MARRQKTAKRPRPKTVLRLPDLEQSKNAVLNSLAAASSQDSYWAGFRLWLTLRAITSGLLTMLTLFAIS